MISRAVSSVLRSVGHTVDKIGRGLQGEDAYVEKLVQSTRVVAFRGQQLRHGLQGFVASTATVVGDVSMGETASVWYGATIRGDTGAVKIGESSSVGDRASISCTAGPVTIGKDVTVGPRARLESCTLSDGVMVGPGAQILAGVTVGPDAYVDGGAVVAAGTKIPGGELWTGSPAKKLRALTNDEMAYLRNTASAVAAMGEEHYGQSIKTVAGLEADMEEKEFRDGRFMAWDEPLPQENPEQALYNRLSSNPEDSHLLRADEYDSDDEHARWEAEEDAFAAQQESDAAELATLERVEIAVEEIFRGRPEHVPGIVADLRDRDEKAADMLEDMMAEVEAAGQDRAAADKLAEAIRAGAPRMDIRVVDVEAEAAAAAAAAAAEEAKA